MFDELGVKYAFINTAENPEERTRLSTEHNWKTIPMIFVDGKFCGGLTDTEELIDQGKLVF